MQPATMSGAPAATLGIPAASKTASMLSSVALWMNEQVFTTTASASAGSTSIRNPASANRTRMRAVSASFFAHPSVTKATQGATSAASDERSIWRDRPSGS